MFFADYTLCRLDGRRIPRFGCTPRAIIKISLAVGLTAACLVVAVSSAEAQIPAAERDALVAFYNSTNGPGWTDSTGWLGGVGTECTWHGITCSGGHVSAIGFIANQLSGPLPPEIGNLTNLDSLVLRGNSITGIPPELGSLQALTRLDLYWNNLTGSIPSELGNLLSVTRINLASNALTGSIPSQLGNLAALERLYLSDNNLSGPLPSSLADLGNLNRLELSYNPIGGQIPTWIGNLASLGYLYVEDADLSGEVPDEIRQTGLDVCPPVGETCTLFICGNQLYTDDPVVDAYLEERTEVPWASCQIPTVRFDWSPVMPTVDEVVQFTDNTTSSPSSWSWVFGDGGSGSVQDPTHVYTAANTFTVTLTASNGVGSDSASRSITVIPFPPVADFTWSPADPMVGHPIQFTDTSTENPTSWSWTFGDGGASTTSNPTHSYTAAGLYDVSLTVGNAGGNDSVTHQITVGRPPVADFSWSPADPEVGESVQFNDQSANHPTGWSWNFGDGGTSTSQNPTHAYSAAATYTVSLAATNALGSDLTTRQVTVDPGAETPVAIFTWDPISPDENEAVHFFDHSTGDPTSWSWDFGDGGTSSEQEPAYVYTACGVFTVTLTVANTAGSHTASDDITVCEAPVTPRDEVPVTAPGVVEEGTDIDTDRSGNRVVVWSQDDRRAKATGGHVVQGGGAGIFGRYFDPDDSSEGDVIEVSEGSGGELGSPTVSFDGAGNFVVGWETVGGAGDGVYGRYFDPGREPLTDVFPVDEGASGSPSAPDVASASGGDLVMVWRDDDAKHLRGGAGIFGRFFEPDGAPKGETIQVDGGDGMPTSEPSVAVAAGGHTLVVWSQRASSKQAGDGVFGRYFDPDGSPEGDPVQVNDDPAGATSDPSVGVDPSGNAVVAWAQDHGGASGWDIFGRRFDRDGLALGEQFAVNTETVGDQTDPSVDVNAAGDFAVAWASGADGVFGRYFNASGTPLGPQFAIAEPVGGVTPTDPEISLGDDRTISLAYVRIGDDDTGQALLRTFDVDSSPSPCSQGANTNCLNRERFQVRVSWRDFQGNTGDGLAVRLTNDTGYYWFFDQANVEVMLKVLGGCGINDHFWVFYGALSNVEYTVVVTDSETGSSVSYFNPSGTFASVGDTEALPCDAKAGQPVHTFREVPVQEWTGSLVAEQTGRIADTCTPSQTTLCLNNDRFKVEATWRDFGGNTGVGDAVTLTGDTGYFWFFDQANVELVIKALDARGVNGCFWVFYGALSNVEYTITVTDTETGSVNSYVNPLGTFGSLGDTEAFCAP